MELADPCGASGLADDCRSEARVAAGQTCGAKSDCGSSHAGPALNPLQLVGTIWASIEHEPSPPPVPSTTFNLYVTVSVSVLG